MNRLATAASVLILSALVACTDSKKNLDPEPNIFPADYKQEILDTLSRSLDDPTNVRGAFISDPIVRTAEKDQRYTVCLRYNARDLSRQYIGSQDHIAYFFGGHLNQLVEATPAQCGNAAYKPFPELEKLCLATKCN